MDVGPIESVILPYTLNGDQGWMLRTRLVARYDQDHCAIGLLGVEWAS